MLPQDIPRADLRGEFLVNSVQHASLYAQLGVVPLSREEFYAEIFCEMEAGRISVDERSRHMHDVYLNYDRLCARSPAFRDARLSLRPLSPFMPPFIPCSSRFSHLVCYSFFSVFEHFAQAVANVRFVEVTDGTVMRPFEVFDPEEPLLASFFPEHIPAHQLPPCWASSRPDYIAFLRKVGMIQRELSCKSVSISVIINCFFWGLVFEGFPPAVVILCKGFCE